MSNHLYCLVVMVQSIFLVLVIPKHLVQDSTMPYWETDRQDTTCLLIEGVRFLSLVVLSYQNNMVSLEEEREKGKERGGRERGGKERGGRERGGKERGGKERGGRERLKRGGKKKRRE